MYKNDMFVPFSIVKSDVLDSYNSRLLLVEYGGRDGELSSISNYLHQSIIFMDIDTEFSSITEKIAEDEMKHFKTIENIFILIKEEPKLKIINNSKKICKNKNIESNDGNLLQAIENNIKCEEKSIIDYKRIYSRLNNKKIKKIINEIIEDEMNHLNIFKNYKLLLKQ